MRRRIPRPTLSPRRRTAGRGGQRGGGGGAAGVTSDAAFFRLAESDLLAAETRDYVPKLIAAALIAKQPAHYGFTPAASAPFGYDSLLVSDATGLDVVARLAGTTLARSGRSTRSTSGWRLPRGPMPWCGCRSAPGTT
jgi:hypothetical protein